MKKEAIYVTPNQQNSNGDFSKKLFSIKWKLTIMLGILGVSALIILNIFAVNIARNVTLERVQKHFETIAEIQHVQLQ